MLIVSLLAASISSQVNYANTTFVLQSWILTCARPQRTHKEKGLDRERLPLYIRSCVCMRTLVCLSVCALLCSHVCVWESSVILITTLHLPPSISSSPSPHCKASYSLIMRCIKTGWPWCPLFSHWLHYRPVYASAQTIISLIQHRTVHRPVYSSVLTIISRIQHRTVHRPVYASVYTMKSLIQHSTVHRPVYSIVQTIISILTIIIFYISLTR